MNKIYHLELEGMPHFEPTTLLFIAGFIGQSLLYIVKGEFNAYREIQS